VLRDARGRDGRRDVRPPPAFGGAVPAVPRPGARRRRLRVGSRGSALRGGAALSAQVATFDELDEIPIEEGFVWRPIRRRFDIRGFGCNAYTSEGIGRQIVEEHVEGTGHEECYIVVRGRARFTLDGEEVDAPAGTIVFIRDHDVRRGAVSEEERTIVFAVGGFPGRPFEVSAWESFFAAIPATRSERWDEAIAIHEAGLREKPGHPAVLFNLARVEARAGRRLDALRHLQDAVRRDPTLAERATRTSDFAAIQREPGFPA
jgi:mannose-6-phosphate isomerase-like protein (cupin superfamily)